MTAPTGITLETGDGPFDLADIVWQQVMPDGRTTGLVMGTVAGQPIVTAEQAGRALAEDEYDECVAAGITWRPRSAETVLAEVRAQRETTLSCGCDRSAQQIGHACLDRQKIQPGQVWVQKLSPRSDKTPRRIRIVAVWSDNVLYRNVVTGRPASIALENLAKVYALEVSS